MQKRCAVPNVSTGRFAVVPSVSNSYERSFLTGSRLFFLLKIMLSMLYIVFLSGLWSASIAEAANTIFRVDSAYGVKKGSSVSIDISAEDFHELYGCYFELEYDPDVVLATDVVRGDMLADSKIFDPDISNAHKGKISVLWFNHSSDLLSGDGGLFRIYFKVEGEGSTVLSVKNLSFFASSGDTPSIINGYISTSASTSNGSLEIVTAASLPRAIRNSSYYLAFKASGGTPPYTWSRAGGSLPPGLRLNSSGVISGTPTSAGSYTFTVRVTDDNYARLEKEFSLTVRESASFYDSGALFKSLSLTRSTMKLELVPENMPYTMLVDKDINWVSLNVSLHDPSDYLRINGANVNSGMARTVPLHTGMNQIDIAVSPDGHLYHNFTLTIYRLP